MTWIRCPSVTDQTTFNAGSTSCLVADPIEVRGFDSHHFTKQKDAEQLDVDSHHFVKNGSPKNSWLPKNRCWLVDSSSRTQNPPWISMILGYPVTHLLSLKLLSALSHPATSPASAAALKGIAFRALETDGRCLTSPVFCKTGSKKTHRFYPCHILNIFFRKKLKTKALESYPNSAADHCLSRKECTWSSAFNEESLELVEHSGMQISSNHLEQTTTTTTPWISWDTRTKINHIWCWNNFHHV